MNIIEYIKSKKIRTEIDQLLKVQFPNPIHNLCNLEAPELLFKYTSINEFIVSDLRDNCLTATAPSLFNDLYDSTMHFNTTKKYLKEIKLINEQSRLLGYEEICDSNFVVRAIEDSEELDLFKQRHITDDFRIVCLSSSEDDIRMWGHYAENNMGICIAYELKKCKNELEKFIFPVVYVDRPIDIHRLFENDENLDLAALISIITKFKDWKDEKEWRIVFYIGTSNTKRIKLLNIPKPKYIILGNRFVEMFQNSKTKNKNKYLQIKSFFNYVINSDIKLKIVESQIRSYKLVISDIAINDIKETM